MFGRPTAWLVFAGYVSIVAVCSVVACSGESTQSVPFATTNRYLTIQRGDTAQPIFIKGMNLGAGLPGFSAGDLPLKYEQYMRWFAKMSDIGVNVLRIYTLHPPDFYRAVFDYNKSRADKPLYILHGLWLDEENPTHTYNLHGLTASFRKNIEEGIDCVHGQRVIAQRFGQASGVYRHDISHWVLGWVLAREIFPEEVTETNNKNPAAKQFVGQHVSLPTGTATEAWAAEQIDHTIAYEQLHYQTTRPVGWSSWPTLDPLTHPTEPKGLTADSHASHEDSEKLDLANLQLHNAPGGFFMSFHAYPYYPNFVSEDPNFRKFSDNTGPNSYLGYLTELKAHYNNIPVLIGEFGVPTSWGNAHFGHSGMHHGGLTEAQQGTYGIRMLENIDATHGGGGMLFVWFDEWWKRTWIVDELAFPRNRYNLWFNVTSPEQNFGLIGFDFGPPQFDKWPTITGAPAQATRITSINAAADGAFFHVKITLASPLINQDQLVVGFDTYSDARGESQLPSGQVCKTRRNEFALVISGNATAQLMVTQAYNLTGIWHQHTDPQSQFRSTTTDGAPWINVRWQNDAAHQSDDGQYKFQDEFQEIGQLKVRITNDTETNLDAVVIDNNTVTIRIPWTLLHVTDPSQRRVFDDDIKTPVEYSAGASSSGRETTESDGIGLAVAIGTDLLETPRFIWDKWDKVPAVKEREKKSMGIFADGLKRITGNR